MGTRPVLAVAAAAVLVISGCATTIPGPSGAPSVRATTPATTSAPVPTAVVTTSPAATPGGAGLLSHIPSDIAATCEGMLVAYPGSVEGLSCRPVTGATVAIYVQFTDQASMDAEFDDQWGRQASAAVDGGLCENGASGVGSVTFNDQTQGRYLCYPSATVNAYWLYWTHEATNILGYAALDGADVGPLFDWWETAGPDLAPTGIVPPVGPEPNPESLPPVSATCVGRPAAPPVTIAELAIRWAWLTGTYYEGGSDYEASVDGALDLGADMRWAGSRQTVTGSFNNPIAYGPGAWTYDGSSLTLYYDDGSYAETYNTVRLGVHQQLDGSMRRDMSLEVAYADGSCTVYVLQEE